MKSGLQPNQSAVRSARFRIRFCKRNHLAHAAHRLEASGKKQIVAAKGYIRERGKRVLVESRHSADAGYALVLDGVFEWCAIPAMSWEQVQRFPSRSRLPVSTTVQLGVCLFL